MTTVQMRSRLIFIGLFLALATAFVGCAATSGVKSGPAGPAGTAQTRDRALPRQVQEKGDAKKCIADGVAAIGRGRLQEAEKDFLEAVRLEPGNYEAHLRLGDIYKKTRERIPALDQYNKARTINPADPRAYLGLMDVYAAIGVKKSAAQVGEEAIKSGVPEKDMAASLGWVYFQLEDLNAAEKYLNIARENLKDDPAPVNRLGLVYFCEGRYDEALLRFREAYKLDSRSGLTPYLTALAEMRLGKEGEALKALGEGLKRDPGLEGRVREYNTTYFPKTVPGDLSALFAKLRAEREKDKAAEALTQETSVKEAR